jgi:hypothetical protein
VILLSTNLLRLYEVAVLDTFKTHFPGVKLLLVAQSQNDPVAADHAAPRVKSGAIVPEVINKHDALALMITDPLLIRRPLMECDGKRIAGFDTQRVENWIGAPLVRAEHGDLQTVAAMRNERGKRISANRPCILVGAAGAPLLYTIRDRKVSFDRVQP